MTTLISCLLSFLIGGIPFGYLIGRVLLKDDIRNHGSGNIGATNVGRVIGWKWGGLVLFLDALKGLLPTLGAMTFAARELPETMHWHLPVAAGISAIVGHMYPVYLKLRGGKGVATALGVVLILAPKAVAVAFAVFLIAVGISRIVAVASMLAAIAFGVTQLWLMGSTALETRTLSLTAFAVGIPLLIVWRHRSNIAKMVKSRRDRRSAS
ncbi:MAG: glycerol-3-phosphate 1-O-acyltransferase PlsY [Planctomycetaceae bacterium]